ncbi:MAG: WYL domain-containing protein [Acidimicrobiia bacterium]|nr:WYL domain-containing protein [Acidimicrobiia bacterium]
MSRLTKDQQFEVLRTVLGMVEEQDSVSLSECSTVTGIDKETLRDTLGIALFVDYRDSSGNLISESDVFLLDENEMISITARKSHWLRDLAASPPDRDSALRLLIAGQAMQAIASNPTPDLDSAVAKLRAEVAIELRLPAEIPPSLTTVRQALAQQVSIKVQYLHDDSEATVARELLPFQVWSRWGHWYLSARDIKEKATKTFRVDRMIRTELGTTKVFPPPQLEIPESFDLKDRSVKVRVAINEDDLGYLPTTAQLGVKTDLGDGRVELDVVVNGDQQINHLLLSLPAEAKVLSPNGYAKLRRELVGDLLVKLS